MREWSGMDPTTLHRLLEGWERGPGPLYERLARAIRELIEAGELPPGSRLPAERRLGELANVSRGTVVNAYELLRERDLIRSRQGSGTTVTGTPAPLRHDGELALTALLGVNVAPPGGGVGETIDLQAASWQEAPDLPADALDLRGEDLDRLLGSHGYFPAGVAPLRRSIADYLSRRGLETGPEQVLVTCGAHQAISLIARMAITPGDPAVVEEVTYPGAADALNAGGARVLTAPLGPDGVRVEELDRLVRRSRPRLVYLVPTAQNPTGVTLPDQERERLVSLAADWEALVVDDESLLETLHEGTAPRPLAAFAGGASSSRILTVGSASKTFWGGLRIGWARGPESLVSRLTRLKTLADLASPVLSQLVAARLLDRVDELLSPRRELLRARVDAVSAGLAELLPEWSWRRPSGGLALWTQLPGADAVRFTEEALRQGVAVVPGTTCSPEGRFRDHVRIGFGATPERLEEAVRRLARAWAVTQGLAPASSYEVIV